MSLRIPNENRWRSVQGTDLFGSIVHSRGVDLSEDGYVTLSKKPCAIFTENTGVAATGSSDFQETVAIAADSTYYYVLTTDLLFGFTISETAISVGTASLSSHPTVVGTSDMVAFNSEIVVSGSATIHTFTAFDGSNGGGTWTDKSITTSTSYPHPLCVFVNRNELCVANGNVVKTYNTSYANQNTLTLPADFIVTSMRWRGTKLYIGTRSQSGGNAMLFVWNGTGTSAESGWPVDAPWIYSVCEYGNSVAVLTSAGQLLRFNGAGFEILANLPVYYTPHTWIANATGQIRGKAINRSMYAIGETIYITIEGEPRGSGSPSGEKQPGGLYVYNPRSGLYHRSGFVSEPYRNLAISSLSSSIFTFASAHRASTGDPVWAHTVSNIAALSAGRVYYAIRESSTAVKLALSPADAHNNRHITCSGTISGDTLSFETPDQVGSIGQVIPGAVAGFTHLLPSKFFASELFFCGAAYDPVLSTQVSALMSFGMGRNVGSIITPKIYGAGLKDSIKKLITNIRGLNLDTDKVVIKYRTQERFGLPTPLRVSGAAATWTDDSNFTIDTTTKDVKSIQVGDEVEFTQGAAAGYTAHITAINDSTSTWTITLDEDVPEIAASDRSDFLVDNWTKLGVVTNASRDIDYGFHEQAIGKDGAWVQFKIELRGRDVAINMLDLISEGARSKV